MCNRNQDETPQALNSNNSGPTCRSLRVSLMWREHRLVTEPVDLDEVFLYGTYEGSDNKVTSIEVFVVRVPVAYDQTQKARSNGTPIKDDMNEQRALRYRKDAPTTTRSLEEFVVDFTGALRNIVDFL